MNLPAGWLSAEEASELQRLASNKTVLELGAWKGRSTVVLAEVATYVVSVDRHHGIEEVGGEDSLPDYLQSVRNLSNVAIVVAQFDKIVPLFGSYFDMAFVDGDHDKQSVKFDVQLAMEHVHGRGIIAMHDWDFESVRAGAAEVFGKRHPDGLAGSVASFTVT